MPPVPALASASYCCGGMPRPNSVDFRAVAQRTSRRSKIGAMAASKKARCSSRSLAFRRSVRVDAIESCHTMPRPNEEPEQAMAIDIARKDRNATTTEPCATVPIGAALRVEQRTQRPLISDDVRLHRLCRRTGRTTVVRQRVQRGNLLAG